MEQWKNRITPQVSAFYNQPSKFCRINRNIINFVSPCPRCNSREIFKFYRYDNIHIVKMQASTAKGWSGLKLITRYYRELPSMPGKPTGWKPLPRWRAGWRGLSGRNSSIRSNFSKVYSIRPVPDGSFICLNQKGTILCSQPYFVPNWALSYASHMRVIRESYASYLRLEPAYDSRVTREWLPNNSRVMWS